ncbi:MAG: hypothetical protein ABJL72_18980 [Roseobacter sp.]
MNFASLQSASEGGLVSIVIPDTSILTGTVVAGKGELVRDIANLANGGYVVADDEGFNSGRVFVRIFDYADGIKKENTSVTR